MEIHFMMIRDILQPFPSIPQQSFVPPPSRRPQIKPNYNQMRPPRGNNVR